MTWSENAVIVIAVVGLALWFGFSTARRLDRLHRKVVSSRLALDSQLLRRAASAYDLASSHALDPVSSVLLAESAKAVMGTSAEGDVELLTAVPDLQELVAAHRDVAASEPAPRLAVIHALDSGIGADREARESSLTAVVEEILESPQDSAALYANPCTGELLDSLAAAWYRVQIARRFHNESVLQAQRVRSKRWIRLFRIAGYAPMPHTVEFDDTWPQGLKAPHANRLAPEVS